MSSRDGPCLKMCSSRQDGRLVVEAVVVRPRGYLQANRQDGRLCLSFIECSARGQGTASSSSAGATEASYFPIVGDKCEQEQELAMEMEEESEEEVEVVDRGTVVEVKISSQPQAPAAAKVHRSTLVINKFMGSTPFTFDQPRGAHADAPLSEPSSRDEAAQAATAAKPTLRRVPSSTTTLAAAVAVASQYIAYNFCSKSNYVNLDKVLRKYQHLQFHTDTTRNELKARSQTLILGYTKLISVFIFQI
jgi:hypothetical protein